jgi:hypothetical protein
MRMTKFVSLVAIAMAAAVPCAVKAQSLASFKGTYTFQISSLDQYSPEYNMYGQQVGFCNSGNNPINYGCGSDITFDLIAGTVVADGAGHISSGSYTQTPDPNSYKCDTSSAVTSPCPVIVPSGHDFSDSVSYKIGNTVDYKIGSTTRTYQAVKANTARPPNWGITNNQYICNGNNSSTCFWTQVGQSLTNSEDKPSSGSLVGSYTVDSNGSGVLTLTPSGCSDCGSIQFAIVVSPTSQVGQTVALSGLGQVGNSNRAVGTAIRVK